MTEPITAMGQLLDRIAEMRGLLLEARGFVNYVGTKDISPQNRMLAVAFSARISSALDRDITTALDDAPQDQRQR